MSSSGMRQMLLGFGQLWVNFFFASLAVSQVSVRNLLKAHCWPVATPYCILFPVKLKSWVISVGRLPKKIPGAAGCGRGDSVYGTLPLSQP